MISYTSTWARKQAEKSLPRNPRKAFYVIYKPRKMPCYYLGKWDREKDAHLDFLKADTPEELWMWFDLQRIPRKHVLDATNPESLQIFLESVYNGGVDSAEDWTKTKREVVRRKPKNEGK